MRNNRLIEGDLIETKDGSIFDVKGLVHPPAKAIAFPRFIPCHVGTRKHANHTYEKIYSLSDRIKFLERSFPQYLIHDLIFDETLCEVPVEDIRRLYKPAWRLRQLYSARNLDGVEKSALSLARLLKKEAGLGRSAIGISGSILAGFHTEGSDVDLIVYGSKNCMKAHVALEKLLRKGNSPILPYDCEGLKTLFDFRSRDTLTSFEDFVRTENRKIMQGRFQNRDYFMRFVQGWTEIREKYGDVRYMNAGYAKLEATVADDSESIFTPCTYKIGNVRVLEGLVNDRIEEIASFRGRFCEQARSGETVVAQGKVERVTDTKSNNEHHRLLLGNKPCDYMILKHQP